MLNTFDVSLHYSIHILTSSPEKLKGLNSGQYVTGQESQEILAWNLHARESQAFVAMVAPKVRPRPGFPRLGCRGGHKSLALAGLDWLFQAVLFWQARPKARQAWPGRAFGRTPDARAVNSNPPLFQTPTDFPASVFSVICYRLFRTPAVSNCFSFPLRVRKKRV